MISELPIEVLDVVEPTFEIFHRNLHFPQYVTCDRHEFVVRKLTRWYEIVRDDVVFSDRISERIEQTRVRQIVDLDTEMGFLIHVICVSCAIPGMNSGGGTDLAAAYGIPVYLMKVTTDLIAKRGF